MPAYLSPIGNSQTVDGNGAPLSGGQIWTYAAGTTTLIATYTGSDGITAQANPIILNSLGLPSSPIWLPAGQAVKLVIQNAASVTQRTVDNVSGINDPSGVTAATEWTAYTGTATYINATSFSVAGDQTNTFQVLRELKTTNTGGTVYSRISASSYSGGTLLTTVTVVNLSGVLDSGLSAVAYGLLSATNPSIPETTIGKAVRVAATASDVRAVVPLIAGTAVNTTSGTSIDFTGIPSWVKRITLSLASVSTNGTSPYIVQLGTSLGVETSGYLGTAAVLQDVTAISATNFTNGVPITPTASAATTYHGTVTLTKLGTGSDVWVGTATGSISNAAAVFIGSASKTLVGTLDRIRLTTSGGANTFDAGSCNLLYE